MTKRLTEDLSYECPKCGKPCNLVLDYIHAANPEEDIEIAVSDCCDVELESDVDTSIDDLPEWMINKHDYGMR